MKMATPALTNYAFAPDSAIWRINRERVLLLGGARALLMQLAHPMVAEAVYHHSYVFQKPLLRLRRTLDLTLALIFGTRAEIAAAVATIEQAHRPAVGRLEQGAGAHAAGAVYNARNPYQGLWIQATLVEGAIHGYETFIAPLSHTDKAQFYEDSKQVGEWMGIRQAQQPATIDDLYAYMQDMIASGEVCVSAKARAIAPFLLGQTLPLVKIAAYPTYRLTVGLLPADIRAQYGYTLSERETRWIAQFTQLTRRVMPHVPPLLRYQGAYLRAVGR
jgi:uncharacterized protein (DUF2236 family)